MNPKSLLPLVDVLFPPEEREEVRVRLLAEHVVFRKSEKGKEYQKEYHKSEKYRQYRRQYMREYRRRRKGD